MGHDVSLPNHYHSTRQRTPVFIRENTPALSTQFWKNIPVMPAWAWGMRHRQTIPCLLLDFCKEENSGDAMSLVCLLLCFFYILNSSSYFGRGTDMEEGGG